MIQTLVVSLNVLPTFLIAVAKHLGRRPSEKEDFALAYIQENTVHHGEEIVAAGAQEAGHIASALS